MKKLMLICSVTCLFLICGFTANAQYVSASKASKLVKGEIERFQKPVVTSLAAFNMQSQSQTVARKVKMVPLSARVRIAFYETFVSELSNQQSVGQTLETTYSNLTNRFPAKSAVFTEIYQEAKDLLEI